MDERMEKNPSKAHKILLSNRKTAAFTGILDVLSFDVSEILLETEQGMLLIKGNDLHVNRLTLEKGEVDVEGRIDSAGRLCPPHGDDGTGGGQRTQGGDRCLRGLSGTALHIQRTGQGSQNPGYELLLYGSDRQQQSTGEGG